MNLTWCQKRNKPKRTTSILRCYRRFNTIMATGFKTPEMKWDAADLRDELAKFKQYCDLIFSGPYSRKTEKEQTSFILLWIGRRGLDTYNNWTLDDAEDRNNPWIIWERFEQYVAPKINHRLTRYQLQQFKH